MKLSELMDIQARFKQLKLGRYVLMAYMRMSLGQSAVCDHHGTLQVGFFLKEISAIVRAMDCGRDYFPDGTADNPIQSQSPTCQYPGYFATLLRSQRLGLGREGLGTNSLGIGSENRLQVEDNLSWVWLVASPGNTAAHLSPCSLSPPS